MKKICRSFLPLIISSFTLVVLLLAIIVHTFSIPALGDISENPFRFPGDAGSASYSTSPFSPLVNPVFTDTPESSFFSYKYSAYRGEDRADHSLMMKIFSFSFFYTRYNNIYTPSTGIVPDVKANVYSIGRGIFFGNIFGFGASYSTGNSPDDEYSRYRSWNLGLLFRPLRVISLGAAFRDVNAEIGGEKLKRNEIYSVSIRPYTSRLTFSADAARIEGESFSTLYYTFSLEGRLVNDISLYMKYDEEKNFLVGLKTPFYLRRGTGVNTTLDGSSSKNRGDIPDSYSFGFSYQDRLSKTSIHVDGNTMLQIKLDREFRENVVTDYFKKRELVFYDIVRGIEEAEKDKGIRGILLKIQRVGLGFAQVQEIRELLKRFKSSGKRVYAFLTGSGNKEYYLATVADKIYYTPNTSFGLRGLAAEVYFFKGLIDRAGIKFESLKRGKYKSFAEPFTRETMSPEFRANLNDILENINKQFIEDIAAGRRMSSSNVGNIFKAGIMTPVEAKSAGYVDEVKYPDEAAEEIGKGVSTISLEQYNYERSMQRNWGSLPVIAVIYVNGSIISGKTRISNYLSNTGNESYEQMLETVFRDRNVRAVVIRINSGGGSATASDYMWRSLVKLKGRYKKPVVISFGNTAASGGYYLACSGDRIFSSRGTLTGSIGVVFGKLTLKELFKKLGITRDVIKMSEFADIFSQSKELSGREKTILQKNIDYTYKRFTDIVMKYRNIKKENLPSVAEGRIFSGVMAKEVKLVDEIGGLAAAIEYGRKISGIDDEYEIKELPSYSVLFGGVLQSYNNDPISYIFRKLSADIPLDLLSGHDDTFYMAPYMINIK